MSTSSLKNIREYISNLRGARYRSLIIHGAALGGKSTFARRLAEVENGVYVDVLSRVADDAELSARVDELDEEWLEQLAHESAATGAPLVVIDEWDFLIPTWGDSIATFIQRIGPLYLEGTVVIVWVLSSRAELENPILPPDKSEGRILALEEIASL